MESDVVTKERSTIVSYAWNKESVAYLKTHWMTKKASDIAAYLNQRYPHPIEPYKLTKCAVIGKARRLRLAKKRRTL